MTWNADADSWDSFLVTQSFFATGVSFAHVRYLEEKGEVRRKMGGQPVIYSLCKTYRNVIMKKASILKEVINN
jgi:hypothetical protein